MKDYKIKLIAMVTFVSVVTTAVPVATHAADLDCPSICENDKSCRDLKVPKGYYAYCNGLESHEVNLVYLNNDVTNEISFKNNAFSIGNENYKYNFYVYKKVVNNPYYVPGVSDFCDKTITMYALSDSKSVSGWTKISQSKVSSNDMVCTSVELAEFLYKNMVNEAIYNTGVEAKDFEFPSLCNKEKDCKELKVPNGFFAYCDNEENHEIEFVYMNNKVVNEFTTKKNAFTIGNDNFKKGYYVYKKDVDNPNYIPGVTRISDKKITLYALSDSKSVSGWSRIKKYELIDSDMVCTSIELGNYFFNVITERLNEQLINPVLPGCDCRDKCDNGTIYFKEDALNFGYKFYPNGFCIMSRVIPNPNYVPNTNGLQMIRIYALSTSVSVDGWEITADNAVWEQQIIFTSIESAEKYYGLNCCHGFVYKP